MTLIQIATETCKAVGKDDVVTIALAKKFAQQRYLMIYDSALWSDSRIVYGMHPKVATFTLPHFIDRVVAVHRENGESITYSELPPVAVRELPISPTKLTIASSSAADKNVSVRVRGDLNGEEGREVVTLGEFADGKSLKTYDTPYVISKPLTSGLVTVTDENGTALLHLGTDEYERRHPRLQLHDFSEATGHINILAKRKPRPLIDDDDKPTIGNINDALVSYVTADLLEALRQYRKAQAKVTEASSLLTEARDKEKSIV